MISVIAALTLGEHLTFGKFHSRAEFRKAFEAVEEGQTEAEVRKALGAPDDIWPSSDGRRYVCGVGAGNEMWLYGTNGHHTFPTLGGIWFSQGRAMTGMHGTPAATNLISEQELREGMRTLHRFDYLDQLEGRFTDKNDPLRMIQAVTELQSLGKDKALAIITEYSNVNPLWSVNTNNFLIWLTHVLFVGKSASVTFPLPRIGAYAAPTGEELKQWTTFPLICVRGFPVNVSNGGSLRGVPEPVDAYIKRCSGDWVIRPDKLLPPDDPFPIFQELASSSLYAQGGLHREMIAMEILRGVRNALPPGLLDHFNFAYVRDSDMEDLHREFLKVGGHWDLQRRCYVRRDGTFTPDPIRDYKYHFYEFPDLGGIRVNVEFERRNRRTVNCNVEAYEQAVSGLSTAVLTALDPSTNKRYDTEVPNYGWQRHGSHGSIEKALFEEAHTGSPGGMGSGLNLNMKPEDSVIFELRYRDKVYRSPIYRPD